MFVQEVGGWVLGGTQTHIPIFTSMYCLSGYKFTWEGFPVNLQLWGKAELFSLLLFMDFMIHGDWIKIEISQEIRKQICIPSTVVCRASLSTCTFSGPTTIVFMAMQRLSSNSSSRNVLWQPTQEGGAWGCSWKVRDVAWISLGWRVIECRFLCLFELSHISLSLVR